MSLHPSPTSTSSNKILSTISAESLMRTLEEMIECCTEPPELMTPLAMIELIKSLRYPWPMKRFLLAGTAAHKCGLPSFLIQIHGRNGLQQIHIGIIERVYGSDISPIAIPSDAAFTRAERVGKDTACRDQFRNDVFPKVVAGLLNFSIFG